MEYEDYVSKELTDALVCMEEACELLESGRAYIALQIMSEFIGRKIEHLQ